MMTQQTNETIPMFTDNELIIFWSVSSITSIIGVVGNLLVVVAVASSPRMKVSSINWLLLFLALVDLGNLVGAAINWIQILYEGTTLWSLWPGWLCRPTKYLSVVALYLSLLTQIVVAVERYVAILHPLHASTWCTRRKCFLMTCMNIMVAGVLAVPYCTAYSYDAQSETCLPRNQHVFLRNPLFKWFEMAAFYFVPFVLLLGMYLRMAQKLWRTPPVYLRSHQKMDKNSADQLKARRRVVVMLAINMLMYFICYSPIQFMFFYTKLSAYRPDFNFTMIVNLLVVGNSSCNPIIYTTFSEKFRTRIFNLLARPFDGLRSSQFCGFNPNITDSIILQSTQLNSNNNKPRIHFHRATQLSVQNGRNRRAMSTIQSVNSYVSVRPSRCVKRYGTNNAPLASPEPSLVTVDSVARVCDFVETET